MLLARMDIIFSTAFSSVSLYVSIIIFAMLLPPNLYFMQVSYVSFPFLELVSVSELAIIFGFHLPLL